MKSNKNYSDILIEGVAIADPELARQYSNAQKQLNDKDAQIVALQKQINTLEQAKMQLQKAMVAIEQKAAQAIQPKNQPTSNQPDLKQNQPQQTQTTTTTPVTNQTQNMTKESFKSDILKIKKINEGWEEDQIIRTMIQNLKKTHVNNSNLNLLDALVNDLKVIKSTYSIEKCEDSFVNFINHHIDKLKVPNLDQENYVEVFQKLFDLLIKSTEIPHYLNYYSMGKKAIEDEVNKALDAQDYQKLTELRPFIKEHKISVDWNKLNEEVFDTSEADARELLNLKNYMDAENISYLEGENTIEFDEDVISPEWRDLLTDVGIKKLEEFTEKSVSEEDEIEEIIDEDEVDEETELTPEEHEKIDEEKVFYVKIEDEGEAFIGKIYKNKDDEEWLSKIVVGESETFDKLYYEPEWDEVDIIAFLRENYADATLIPQEEYNEKV